MGLCDERRSTMTTYAVIFSVVLATLISAGGALKITELKVPDVIQNGTRASVVLDCDYTFEQDSPLGLVIKWFFDGNPSPVYQWIAGKTPQGLGVLKNRLNLGYRASTDEHKVHRALQILNPSTELTGEYKCVVSTFASEVSQAKTMVIYVPEKELEVTQTRAADNGVVNITCVAEGVFPEPRMTITRKNSAKKLQSVHVLTIPHDGVFDIYASVLVDDDDSDESNESDDADDSDGDVDIDGDEPTEFECELEIPDANYTIKKATIFYPGPPTTTVEPDSDELSSESPDPNSVDANLAPRVTASWTLLLSVVVFLRL